MHREHADYTDLTNQPSWLSVHVKRQQVTGGRLLSEDSILKERLLLMLAKVLEVSRQLPDVIRSCSLSQVSFCDRLVTDIHALRREIADRLKVIDEAGEIKKRFLRLTFRFDQVARKLRKIVELSCKRSGEAAFCPGTITELDQLFAAMICVVQGFLDHLYSSDRTSLDAFRNRAKELRDQTRRLRSAICNGWHIGFCFTEETRAYWNTLDLMLSVGTSLQEAAEALLALQEGAEGSGQWSHGPEPRETGSQPVGVGHACEPSSQPAYLERRKETGVMLPKKILLCTDLSENCVPAQRLAIDYAKSFGATLVLFHVIDPGALGYPRFEDLVPMEDTLKSLELACDRELKALHEEIQEEIPLVKAYSVSGVPDKEIVGFAKEQDIDLIVMGTHGWTGLNRLLLGSTAEQVVRTATCPVLIVRSFPSP